MKKGTASNRVYLRGEIISGFTFSHRSFGESFYVAQMEISRLSETVDTIPIMVSGKLIDTKKDFTGSTVKVSGQFRSYNKHQDDKTSLELYVFVKTIRIYDGAPLPDGKNNNSVFLDGHICKSPVYRTTPFGREITDIILSTSRSFGKLDYIPCIAWGRYAEQAAGFDVGTRIRIRGRIQSRNYQKKISETETEIMTALEVSAGKLQVVE